jgi:DNA-binding response OmpR family regulator
MTTTARILLVDDEQDLVWAVQHSLCDEGYEVLTAADGIEAIAVAQRRHPDLIILDIVMPRLDGMRVIHSLRRDPNLAAVPVLFLTGRSAIEDRIQGFDEGADDYLVKPFDLRELKVRIQALLRRSQRGPGQTPEERGESSLLTVGALTLNLRTFQVRMGETEVQLTRAEFDLLRYLMMHPGQVFSSQQLLEEVWNYPPGTADPGLVRWHIMNLRAKLEPLPCHSSYIRTISHLGYILDAS